MDPLFLRASRYLSSLYWVSRSDQSQFAYQRRPAPTADAERWASMGAFCGRFHQMSCMKYIRLFSLAVALLLVSTGMVGAVETNGFLVFEVERLAYTGRTNESDIKQSFKVPLTEGFMSNFKHAASQNSSGTGFCCAGGNLKTSAGSTRFTWWIRKTADNRWRINMWGEGVETMKGVTMSSRNPKTSHNLTITRWEDLDMGY